MSKKENLQRNIKKAKKKPLLLSISEGGKLSFIYSDSLAPLLKEGTSKITRVSNVEPTNQGWISYLKDGTKLGPFPMRQQALDAEVKYLEGKLFDGKSNF